ncbi:MAG: hypothetical protein JNK05_20855 [Myxococcales bacterium]|nr:hypothetical protein [Myxococcales bacterium]
MGINASFLRCASLLRWLVPMALFGCPPSRPEGDATASADVSDSGADAPSYSSAELGDLRFVEAGAPRCTNDTRHCVEFCRGSVECDMRCLELDFAPTESVAIGWVNCRTCVRRQRDVCAAENGCASEVRAFVVCSDACRGDADCIAAMCPGARGAVDRCAATAAGGMCLTTFTHPAVFACFGLRPQPDSGV